VPRLSANAWFVARHNGGLRVCVPGRLAKLVHEFAGFDVESVREAQDGRQAGFAGAAFYASDRGGVYVGGSGEFVLGDGALGADFAYPSSEGGAGGVGVVV
jgi:hypothetical protein